MEQDKCSVFKVRTTNQTGTVRFMCPSCGKGEIIRCKRARQLATPYVCPSCGFDGPN